MGILRKVLFIGMVTMTTGCFGPGGLFPDGLKGEPPGAVHLEQNPFFIPLNREQYHVVFEKVLHVLVDYGFEILESNRHDGRIETMPRTAPGLGLLLKPGSPDMHERCLATLQSYRHRITVLIQGSERGGYFITVQAHKELEDLPRPIRSTVGSAIFRTDNNIDREFEVIDAVTPDSGWLSKGRDPALESELIRRIRDAK